jgi:hypothetical protein
MNDITADLDEAFHQLTELGRFVAKIMNSSNNPADNAALSFAALALNDIMRAAASLMAAKHALEVAHDPR